MANDVSNMSAFEGEAIAGRYRLERFLDGGNFGAVYRASQLAYGLELRQVAIKIAKRPMSDSEARRAFDEALTMARVADTASDPALRQHFVSVFDAGRCPEGGALAGHPYVAMELISGGSVKNSLKLGPFPLTRAVAYFDQMLRGMAFMHQNDLVHRDLKPGNILISRRQDGSDVVKISDFGLVIEVDRLLRASSGGDSAYLAPESFSDDDRCSRQSDVYMLGLVFHEMLTGVNPFSEVGAHLRGSDESKHPELRRLHLAARHHRAFPTLEQHAELKERPALAAVIRNSLQADVHASIPFGYRDVCRLGKSKISTGTSQGRRTALGRGAADSAPGRAVAESRRP